MIVQILDLVDSAIESTQEISNPAAVRIVSGNAIFRITDSENGIVITASHGSLSIEPVAANQINIQIEKQ